MPKKKPDLARELALLANNANLARCLRVEAQRLAVAIDERLLALENALGSTLDTFAACVGPQAFAEFAGTSGDPTLRNAAIVRALAVLGEG